MPGAMAKPPLIDDDMVTRKFCCEKRDVVYVKSVVMGYDGLCCLFSEGGGELILAAPRGREAELDRLVDDVTAELGGMGSNDPKLKTEA